MAYDFLNLSPLEFENLTRDLIQAREKITLESFMEGKDGGIDFRFSPDQKHLLIVQAKRYRTFSDLKRQVKKEVLKIKNLKPKRYILSTSVELTPSRKNELMRICRGLVKKTRDILGREDLNNLLSLFPNIEKSHLKLWLTSLRVLEKITESKIYNQSSFEEEEIKETVKYYVPNDSFKKALKIIKRSNFVIISGIPGIGKTTLARMLAYNFLSSNYHEFIYLSNSIDDAYTAYKQESSQIFLFDDFLGRNSLRALKGNEENRILKFISKISKSKNKILIITTREYILNQAKIKYEDLNDQKLNFNKCILDLSHYNNLVKAKILYNHLYFSDIPSSFKKDILKKDRYLRIIDHPNYSPRIIDILTKKEEIWRSIKPKQFASTFIKYLNNPLKIWEHVFENQISDLSRLVLIQLALKDDGVSMDTLANWTKAFSSNTTPKLAFSKILFRNALKELENTFISTLLLNESGVKDEHYVINFQNPGVRDYLTSYINNDRELVQEIIKNAINFSQIIEFELTIGIQFEDKIYVNKDEYCLWRDRIIALLHDHFLGLKDPLDQLQLLDTVSLQVDVGEDLLFNGFIEYYLRQVEFSSLDFYDKEDYLKIVKRLKNTEWFLNALNAFATSVNDFWDLGTFVKAIDENDYGRIPRGSRTSLEKKSKLLMQNKIDEVLESGKDLSNKEVNNLRKDLLLVDNFFGFSQKYVSLLEAGLKGRKINEEEMEPNDNYEDSFKYESEIRLLFKQLTY